MALAELSRFWHRTDELGQGCCPILAAKAEEAPKDLTLVGFHAIVSRARTSFLAWDAWQARSATVAFAEKACRRRPDLR